MVGANETLPMSMPASRKTPIPFRGLPAETFQELAEFLRSAGPRWLTASRSLARLVERRSRRREAIRGSRRGIRHVDGPATTHKLRSVRQPSF